VLYFKSLSAVRAIPSFADNPNSPSFYPSPKASCNWHGRARIEPVRG
jgi:hypothetical protein